MLLAKKEAYRSNGKLGAKNFYYKNKNGWLEWLT